MARLLILDTNATVDAGGAPLFDYAGNPVLGHIDSTLPLLVSKPVRLYGALDGNVEEIAYEMLFEGGPVIVPPNYIDIVWWQEFFSDGPSLSLPTVRTAAGVAPTTKWPRETITFGDGCSPGDNQIAPVRTYLPQRKLRIADGVNTILGPNTEFSALVPCKVNGLFVRLAVNFESAIPISNENDYRLRIWAIVGGQDKEAVHESELLPYVP